MPFPSTVSFIQRKSKRIQGNGKKYFTLQRKLTLGESSHNAMCFNLSLQHHVTTLFTLRSSVLFCFPVYFQVCNSGN